MQNSYDRDDIPRVIIEEHLALRTASRWLLSFLEEVAEMGESGARRAALGAYLQSLEQELARHFVHEEHEEGLCECHVGPDAFKRLRLEHRLMLANVGELHLSISAGSGLIQGDELEDLDSFLSLLARHEAEERRALENHKGQ